MSNPMINRRYGRFQIGINLLSAHYKEILELLAEVFVIRCEFVYHASIFEYTGASKEFRVLKEGEAPDIYDILIDEKTGKFVFRNIKLRPKFQEPGNFATTEFKKKGAN